MPNWSLRLEYDYRFGLFRITPTDPKGKDVATFGIQIPQLLSQAKIPPHELRALIEESKKTEPPLIDIEPVRQEAIKKLKLKGKTVLDIGGYDGWAAKLALDCGAKTAICIDNQQYHHYGWEDTMKEGVDYLTSDFMEWDAPVDLTIFYNVLYHLKNPWRALDHLRTITKGTMLLCTLFRYHDGPWMYVYEPEECNPTDETVYFGPSILAIERLLKATGWTFKQEGLALDRVVYTCKPIKGWERSHEDT